MPDYGKRTGRDAFESLERRLASAERELRRARGGGLSTIDRGDTASQPAPVEGQVMIQYDTDVPYVYANGAWHTLGGGAKRQLGAGWTGPYPVTVLSGTVWKVPLVAGVSKTFNLTRALFRLEAPAAGTTTVRIQKSAGGSAFSGSPTTVANLTLTGGAYETSTGSGLGTVTSGDLLRIAWVAVGTNARGYLVLLEGTET